MPTRPMPVLAVVLLAVTALVGCSADDAATDEQAATLAQLQHGTELIGDDLLAQVHGDLARNQPEPASRAVSAAADSARYWSWSTRVRLTDYADRTPAQAAKALADHLIDQGWQAGTVSRPASGVTGLYRADEDGAWEVDLAAPAQHTVEIKVLSPVTTGG
ncbi:hypothetical protein [Luteimicrobium sp. DT211]|uniref:hypothetical protein n=1 Tax=Luteimicrobium sp. DT211 TaxID=3393412 RepID=UPI003CF7FF67